MQKLLQASIIASAVYSGFFIGSAKAANIYETFPTEISANEKYVFYSHGFIVEGTNATPKNERWGIYQFPAIKSALSDPDYNLIAYHRAAGIEPFEHAKTLAKDVSKLLKKGVSAKNITIIGFSRGAFITSVTSHYLEETPVNTILLAGCGRIVSKKYDDIKANGHLLSIYETTDGASTCQRLEQKSTKLKTFTEISISTGKEHGAFYTPMLEWVIPVKAWIKEKTS
jgi:hypothetical protein